MKKKLALKCDSDNDNIQNKWRIRGSVAKCVKLKYNVKYSIPGGLLGDRGTDF